MQVNTWRSSNFHKETIHRFYRAWIIDLACMKLRLCVSNALRGPLGSHSWYSDTVALRWPFASSWPKYLNSLHSTCSSKNFASNTSQWMCVHLQLAQCTTLTWLLCHTFTIWGINKSLNQRLCSNVSAWLSQCEALIWTPFFVGHAVLASLCW